MKVFSIYDGKAQAFAAPFFMPTIGMAVRAFTELVNDKASTVNRYPSDFTLFQVGEFDEQKGIFQNVSPHINLGLASGFVVPVKSIGLPGMEGLVGRVENSAEVVK